MKRLLIVPVIVEKGAGLRCFLHITSWQIQDTYSENQRNNLKRVSKAWL